MITTTVLCDSHTCARPGCSPEAGCQGHVVRELAPANIQSKAEALVREAEKWGLVLTIEQGTTVSVRPARKASGVSSCDCVGARGSMTPRPAPYPPDTRAKGGL